MADTKKLVFVGRSLENLRDLGEHACKEIGDEILSLQYGGEPRDWKPFPLGSKKGVYEIRCRTVDGKNQLRSAYVVRFPGAIYVLQCWQKKTGKTSLKDKSAIERSSLKDLFQVADVLQSEDCG